jgi:hypothetical protein
MTVHEDYVSKYPSNSEIRRNKFEDFKRNVLLCHAVFSKYKPINETKEVTIASYIIAEILARKKPFEDGNMIKECLGIAGN